MRNLGKALVGLLAALERMTQLDLIFADQASNRMLAEPSPLKKIASLHRLAPEAAAPHDFFFVNKTSGERVKLDEYRPLDKQWVSVIHGRLGDLLHPKDGLNLGVPGDPWYTETRRFLEQSLEYLESVNAGHTPFFAWDGVDGIEAVARND